MNRSQQDPISILKVASDLSWRQLTSTEEVDNMATAIYTSREKPGIYIIEKANGDEGWVLRDRVKNYIGGRFENPGDLMRDAKVREALGLPRLPARPRR